MTGTLRAELDSANSNEQSGDVQSTGLAVAGHDLRVKQRDRRDRKGPAHERIFHHPSGPLS